MTARSYVASLSLATADWSRPASGLHVIHPEHNIGADCRVIACRQLAAGLCSRQNLNLI